ncbi:hypothetical protein LTR37_009243 [Vermiconidia calcicola]|uniref:Uncharacterized protein n=1 Tax=Vermiconidia calcicola TaxID=1690605 RepID=A0ACC3N8S9_9PEZI|nr:hypothetical protein LTR37_009243 [Vermiconidia calcicola]
MSLGFSISDFITVGELAHRLWKDVYMVARKAPAEVRELTKELNALDGAIKLLTDEAQNSESVLVTSGQGRVDMINQMMSATKETLIKLEVYAKKHGLLAQPSPQRSKIQRGMDRVKYAKDAGSIQDLRAKISYHCNILQLLLTSIGNSSLERLRADNEIISRDQTLVMEVLRSWRFYDAWNNNNLLRDQTWPRLLR